MKTILLLLLSFNTFAQQLILNGSFEQGLTPNQSGQIYKCTDWVTAGESPDYYSYYSTVLSGVNLPFTFSGSVTAQEGLHCVGLATWMKGWDNYREYLCQHLDQPLIKNKYYELEFWAYTNPNPILYGGVASDNFGVLFSKHKPAPDGTGIINRQPQCVYPSTLYCLTWTKLHFVFQADSAYRYITFGCYVSDSIQQRINITTASLFDCSYYFLDNISLKELSAAGIQELQAIKKKRVLLYHELLGQKIK